MVAKFIDHRMSVDQPASNQGYSLSEFSRSEAVHLSEGKNLTREITDLVSARTDKFHHYRFELEQDVWKLRDQLRQEMELRALLQRATYKDEFELSRSSSLPRHAQELLSTIAVLEATVLKLEQEIVYLHFLLIQEKNERRLAEYQFGHSSSPSRSSLLRHLKHSENAADSVGSFNKDEISCNMDHRTLLRSMPSKGLWDDNANELSEEMVRCMKNIYVTLGEPSAPSKSSAQEISHFLHREHPSNSSSWWSPSERSRISWWKQSPRIDVQKNSHVLTTENDVFDPYRVQGKLSWADIGSYRLATEVSWMSVQEKQLECATEELRRYRTLTERLARVNPTRLSCNEKLAFWINIYNALIMHAYLAYGVPKTDLKFFSLMQKAAYTVGGHSYSAAAIEYVVLKMKTPLHRPHIALLLSVLKLKVSEEQQQAAIDTHEPLVCSALSCGMYSSPAVGTYTAKNVRDELEEAHLDFIQAAVGVSLRGKLLLPRMLHRFAKNFVDDSKIALWISRHLPPSQAAFVEQCISQRRRQSFLCSSWNDYGVVPFDPRFRYLFLP